MVCAATASRRWATTEKKTLLIAPHKFFIAKQKTAAAVVMVEKFLPFTMNHFCHLSPYVDMVFIMEEAKSNTPNK